MRFLTKRMMSLKARNAHRSAKLVPALIVLLSITLGAVALKAERRWRSGALLQPSAHLTLPSPQIGKPNKAKPVSQRSSNAKPQRRSKRLKIFKSKAANDNPGFTNQRPRTEEEFEGDVEQRREWFISQRTFPFDELPDQARQNAWQSRPFDVDMSYVYSNESVGVLQWQQIGPTPTTSFFPGNWGKTSGRINAIAVSPTNPNLVLVGAATGGVWRSIDGGTTFSPASDNQIDLAVGSIAFAPSNNSIVYAGMGDKDGPYLGTGILRSSDGGQTWIRVSNNTLPPYGRISQVLVDSTDANRVSVAQYVYSQTNSLIVGGFYFSTDGGVNWTSTISGTARDLVRHPTQPNTLYLALGRVDAANGSSGGVFKSTNNGQTWTRIYTSPFGTTADNIKIAVTPAAPQNLYVLVGKSTAQVEVSTNEGGNWTNKGSNFDVEQFLYNCYLFVHPTNANTIFVGTRDLWRSTNGGTTYTNITNNFSLSGNYTPGSSKAHPDQHHLYISPSNPNTIYIANDGGLWKSTDGAGTFTSLNATLSLTMFTSYELHPTDASRSYGGTQDNGTQKRTGPQTWREFVTGDGGQTFVDPLDPSIVYTTYVLHKIYRYTNNGEAFGATIGNDENSVFSNDRVAFYPPFVGNEINSNLYFGTYRLWVSTNRGASWTAPGGTTDLTFGQTLSAIGVARSNTNFIYTGSSDGRVMVSTNGGANWTDRTAGLPLRFIKSISVSTTDPNTAFLTVSGFGSGHVFKTTNAGASWINISGNLPDIPTNTLLVEPRAGNSNTLYVGTDIGVFRSTIGGTTWETFNNGLPPTIITELDAQASGLMQVGTYGRGAFEINLNGSAASGLQFSSATYSVNENAGTATITVTRTGSAGAAASVNYASSNGTATSGQDYTATTGTLNFASGETSKTVTVSILDDASVEGNETINLGLSSPVGATIGSPSTAVLTVVDNDVSCTYTLSSTSQSFGTSSGTGSFNVTTAAGCSWSAVSNASWITTTSTGSGNGTVNFAVAANSGAQRTGSITVGGQTFTVTQSAAGGGCPSTAISFGQSINGTLTTSDCIFSGTTRYVDVYNFSATAGQQIAVTLSSSTFDTYLYLVNSSNQIIDQNDDGGGSTNSRIPAVSGFFSLPAAGSYSIYATSFSIDGTTGSTGAYTISVASASCSYSLSQSTQTFGASSANGSFGVTSPSGCSWAAVSNASWLTTTSNGLGTGSVSFAVAANTGAVRMGVITVGGQTFTVTQNAAGGGCPSTAITVGQTLSGTLTTADCIFTGTTRYVDVYNFSGTAGQQVAIAMNSSFFDTYLYLLDANNQVITQDDDGGDSTNSRIPDIFGFFTLPATGTYTIYATSYSSDGTTGSTGSYSISLSGATSCTYALSPAGQSFGASGGSSSFNVTSPSSCGWSAVSNVGWITTNSSGSGNGTVGYLVASNSGASRTGTITVAGQTFTVTQSAGGGTCPSTTIAVGQTINGTLTTSDCIFSGTTRYVDVYNFSGTTGQQIAVAMTSQTFDTYLYLVDGSNQIILQDDDSGGGTDSRIPAAIGSFTLPAAGSYTIYATSYSAFGTTGSTGGYTITLSSGSCSYALSPTSQSFGPSSASGSFSVTTSAGCSWSTVSNASWLTTTSSGSGSGTVNYSVAANTGSISRTGTITVGGQSFTVNQTAAGAWEPVALTAGQAEIRTWTTGGRTYAYLKLLFPNAGYRVTNWGQATRASNDFTADAAVEKFSGASVQAVTTTAQIYDLGPLANGTYNFNFKTSGTLAKTLQFTVSSTVPPPNPIDDARQFVKQQYRDFLNREADQAGEDFWTDNISKCNDPARRPPGQTVEQCTLRQRETTSGAFFLSPEFQYTGYFVYRMYQGGLGRQPKLSEFIPDAQFVGNGIIVNGQLSGAKINQNKAAFAAQFVNCTDATKYRCAEFKAIYDGLNNQQYVDKLFQTTGVNASASDRAALLNGMNANPATETRATVLQKVVDGINVIAEGNQQFTTTYGQAFYNSEFNRAFVELEYFGYMKRDPDDAGYAFWLGKLNQFSGNFVNAEMVLAFISSPEYRARFGQP